MSKVTNEEMVALNWGTKESFYSGIFNRVKDKSNWKLPTAELIYESRESADQGARVLQYFCGGVEIRHDMDDDVWVVSSKGYYHYIGA